MQFPVESDVDFAGEVSRAAAPLPVSGVLGSGRRADPYQFAATPDDVLLAIGRATAAIQRTSMALFMVSAQWAIVRWFWAFDWTIPRVGISHPGDEIRNHHRTTFSESLGLGAGLLVTEHLVGGRASPLLSGRSAGHILIDVDSVWRGSGLRPDLVVVPVSGGAPLPYILEAKGNRSGRADAKRQLRDGINQVSAITGNAERLVVGVSATRPHRFDAYAIRLPHVVPLPREKTIHVDEILGPALDFERRRIALLAGDDAAQETQPPAVFDVPEAGVDVRGRRFRLRTELGTAVLTIGVERDVFDATREAGDLTTLAEVRKQAVERARVLRAARVEDPEQRLSLVERRRSVAFAEDGSVLSVALE
jgi:hypothetical protein